MEAIGVNMIGRQPVTAIRRFNQKQRLAVLRVQAIDHFLGQHDAERMTHFADLEFDHGKHLAVITKIITRWLVVGVAP